MIKILKIFYFVLLISLTIELNAQHISGTGTEGDPYMLYDAQDLDSLRVSARFPFDGHLFFKLNNNIDLSSYPDWIPINVSGSPTTVWRNHLDLNDMTISNLSMTTTRALSAGGMGLFTVIGDDASNINAANIYNGKIQNVNFTFTGTLSATTFNVGIVSANTYNAGTVDRFYVREIIIEDAQINATWTGTTGISVSIGGVVGDNYKNLYRIYADIDINVSINATSVTQSRIGGIAGFSAFGRIEQCAFVGSVIRTGTYPLYYVGGIVGNFQGDDIVNCYAKISKITNSTHHLGGITGQVDVSAGDSIKYCYTLIDTSDALIATGDLDGLIIGFPTDADCKIYSTYTDTEYVKVDYFFGTTNNVDRTIRDANATNPTADSGKAYTTAQMKEVTNFTSWDFTNVWNRDSTNNINDGYPYLRWNVPVPEVLVTYPDLSGLIFASGDTITITWTTSEESMDWKLYYSLNSGSNWTFIDDSDTNYYSWIIPDVFSIHTLIRVTFADSSEMDQSNNEFIIIADYANIVILSPQSQAIENDGDASVNIVFASIFVDEFNLYWSSDSSNWKLIDLEYPKNAGDGIIPDTTTYAWSLPDVLPQGNIYIRVRTVSDTLLNFGIRYKDDWINSGLRTMQPKQQGPVGFTRFFTIDDVLYTGWYHAFVYGWYDYFDKVGYSYFDPTDSTWNNVSWAAPQGAAFYPSYSVHPKTIGSTMYIYTWNRLGFSHSRINKWLLYPSIVNYGQLDEVITGKTDYISNDTINYQGYRYIVTGNTIIAEDQINEELVQTFARIDSLEFIYTGYTSIGASNGFIFISNNDDQFINNLLIHGNYAYTYFTDALQQPSIYAQDDELGLIVTQSRRNYFRGIYPNAIITITPVE